MAEVEEGEVAAVASLRELTQKHQDFVFESVPNRHYLLKITDFKPVLTDLGGVETDL